MDVWEGEQKKRKVKEKALLAKARRGHILPSPFCILQGIPPRLILVLRQPGVLRRRRLDASGRALRTTTLPLNDALKLSRKRKGFDAAKPLQTDY